MNKMNRDYFINNKFVKHVFISSKGKNLESIHFPYYNSSKAALSSLVKSYQLIYSNYKNVKILLVEPGLINTKLIKSKTLVNFFSIQPETAAYQLFNNIFFNDKKYLFIGKRYIFINMFFKLLPNLFKKTILKNYSSEYVSK